MQFVQHESSGTATGAGKDLRLKLAKGAEEQRLKQMIRLTPFTVHICFRVERERTKIRAPLTARH